MSKQGIVLSGNVLDSLSYFYERHDVYCNQKYGEHDELPYSFHLKMVVAVVLRFIHLISKEHQIAVVIAAAGHDAIEDGRLTFNDIKNIFGEFVAEIIFSCTDEKGRGRPQRHSEKFYKDLSRNRWGVFIKLCDVIANGSYSRIMGSRMFENYQNDLPEMKERLYVEGEYDEIWTELNLMLS